MPNLPLRRAAVPAFAALLLSAAAGAQERSRPAVRPTPVAALDTAVLAGGCFWGVEGLFEHVDGVRAVTSGFATAARDAAAPVSYEQVSTGLTGYAEAVQVVYDPARVSYAQLLHLFFTVAHDPTEVDRQGPDVGPQYRSAVFVRDDAQRRGVQAALARLRADRTYPRPVATRVEPLAAYHEAEPYHQDYMARNPDAPYIVAHDAPKLARFRREYPALYRARAAR
jgi:peptide-methionine (S)-S-oxide reductase